MQNKIFEKISAVDGVVAVSKFDAAFAHSVVVLVIHNATLVGQLIKHFSA